MRERSVVVLRDFLPNWLLVLLVVRLRGLTFWRVLHRREACGSVWIFRSALEGHYLHECASVGLGYLERVLLREVDVDLGFGEVARAVKVGLRTGVDVMPGDAQPETSLEKGEEQWQQGPLRAEALWPTCLVRATWRLRSLSG